MGMLNGNPKKRKRSEREKITLAYPINPAPKKAPGFQSIAAINDKYFEEGNASKRMKGSGGMVIASKSVAEDRSASSVMTASNNTQKHSNIGSSFEKVS